MMHTWEHICKHMQAPKHIHAGILTHAPVPRLTHTYTHASTLTHKYIYVHGHSHTHMFTYGYTCSCTHIHIHACTHTNMHAHTYTHTHTHKLIWLTKEETHPLSSPSHHFLHRSSNDVDDLLSERKPGWNDTPRSKFITVQQQIFLPINFQCRLSYHVRTAHASTSVHTLKIPNAGSHTIV